MKFLIAKIKTIKRPRSILNHLKVEPKPALARKALQL
jgi:hypothetical protein